jgi:hypothetical protein
VVEAPWLFWLFAVAALVIELFSLALDLSQRGLCSLHPLAAFPRRALFGGPDPPIAGFRIRIDLALELFYHGLGLCHLPIQRRLSPERASSRARPYPHPVLRQLLQIDQPCLVQSRQMFDQQTVEQVGTADPEVRQRVIVQRHATAEPAVDVVTVAEPIQGPRAANAIARSVQPKRQQQPRRWRRITRPVLPRLDAIFQLAQVEPCDISPDHPRRMILPDQAIDIDRLQLDLIAHRLAQPRCAPRHCFASWRRLFRQFAKKSVVSHHRSPANQSA